LAAEGFEIVGKKIDLSESFRLQYFDAGKESGTTENVHF
jgi:hypothetical protein